MAEIDLRDVEVILDCPNCTYKIFCLLAEVDAGITLTCPCCRRRVRLHDSDSSIPDAEAEIAATLRDFFKGFK